MEPPRLRMKSPAVTMVAQRGPLPPPLGLLGVGGLKSLQGLSLGMGAGISLLLPPPAVAALCNSGLGELRAASLGVGDEEQSSFSALTPLFLELTAMKPLSAGRWQQRGSRTSLRLYNVPGTAVGDTGAVLCSHLTPLSAPPEPRWLWDDAVGRGAVSSLCSASSWNAKRGAGGGGHGVGGCVDPPCRARLALGQSAELCPGSGQISQRGWLRASCGSLPIMAVGLGNGGVERGSKESLVPGVRQDGVAALTGQGYTLTEAGFMVGL